jgi:hypothetical protein
MPEDPREVCSLLGRFKNDVRSASPASRVLRIIGNGVAEYQLGHLSIIPSPQIYLHL